MSHHLAGQCLAHPGGPQSLDTIVEGDLVEMVTGKVLRGITADRRRFTRSLDVECQSLPQLDTRLGVLQRGGDRDQIIDGVDRHQVIGMNGHHLAVRPLCLANLAHVLVRLPDVVHRRSRFGRLGPVIQHRLETLFDRGVEFSESALAETPLELRIGSRLAVLVQRQVLLVLGHRHLPLLLAVVLLGNLQLVTLDLAELLPAIQRQFIEPSGRRPRTQQRSHQEQCDQQQT